MIVAGVGFRRDTSAEEIERVVRLALGMFRLAPERLDAIATESEKATEPGFVEAARRMSVKLIACTVADLDRVAGQVLTPSLLALGDQRRAVDRRGIGARRGRAQCADCWARGSRPQAPPAPLRLERGDDGSFHRRGAGCRRPDHGARP